MIRLFIWGKGVRRSWVTPACVCCTALALSPQNLPRHKGRGGEDSRLPGSCSICFFRFVASFWVKKVLHLSQLLAVFLFVGVADTIRVATLRNICHTVASLSSCRLSHASKIVLCRTRSAFAYPQDTEFGAVQLYSRVVQKRRLMATNFTWDFLPPCTPASVGTGLSVGDLTALGFE